MNLAQFKNNENENQNWGRLAVRPCTVFLVLMTMGLSACGKVTSTSSSSADTAVAIQGTRPSSSASARVLSQFRLGDTAATSTSNASLNVLDKSGNSIGTLTLTDARIALKEIKIQLAESEVAGNKEKEDDRNQIKLKGPYIVNLLTDEVSPSIDPVSLLGGVYKKIQMKIHKIKGEEKDKNGSAVVASSDPLYGNSIYLTGTYTGQVSGGSVSNAKFVLSYDIDEEFELKGSGETATGFKVVAGAANSVVIAFRLVDWFGFNSSSTNEKQVDFTKVVAATQGDGSSLIQLDKDSQGNNSEIRNVIKENIKRSADYGKDSDGSGKLESVEDANDSST